MTTPDKTDQQQMNCSPLLLVCLGAHRNPIGTHRKPTRTQANADYAGGGYGGGGDGNDGGNGNAENGVDDGGCGDDDGSGAMCG